MRYFNILLNTSNTLFSPSFCHSTVISVFFPQRHITYSPTALLSARVQQRVHFLLLQGEFAGHKNQQGFSWFLAVFNIIYHFLGLTAFLG